MNRKMRIFATAALVSAVPAVVLSQGREVVTTGGRGSPTLSTAVKSGGIVYASGQLPAGTYRDSSIEAQTASALENVKRVFEAAGTSMDQAVKCTVFLVDLKDFQGMNSAYARYWSPEKPPPARSTVVVAALVVPGARLEVECMAAIPR
ncbi:MAG: RidA family protein [Gemmatimonadaceae bacterium]|nr:RidA family protein [Gemmatimonadaceae bacterium]